MGPGMPLGLTITAQTLDIEGPPGQIRMSGSTTFSSGRSQNDAPLTMPLDGKELVPMAGASLALRLIDDHIIEFLGKMSSSALNYQSASHFVLSADGLTLTETKTLTQRETVTTNSDPSKANILRNAVHVLVFRKVR